MLSQDKQAVLIAASRELTKKLMSVQVPKIQKGVGGQSAYGGKQSAGVTGMPASNLAQVTRFMERVTSREQLLKFLAVLPQLDELTAQNQRYPAAYFKVLSRELTIFINSRSAWGVDELFYCLSWTRRLLPQR